MSESSRQVELARVVERLKEWRRLHRIWWGTHYGVGVLGVAAGALISIGDKLPINATYVGIIAAISTSLVTFLGPLSKAQRYWLAFHQIDQACLEFEAGELSTKQLTRACKKARDIVTSGTAETGLSDTTSSSAAAAE